ncbi:rod-binding protein [Yersinia kristensenii]|uniref:Flagellar rod assembly protein/muramidase FlgJ n=1 Tax=Yersinia kristensenii TaxID=28152 RepID=A0AB73PKA5_YERKR|nr:rod-binding protein [Yersinia kristensenii]OVZ78889.1 flagellar rod assembly protein/muramidase FlgJ [Yersinia kristensenii]CNG87833.1 flagellar protein [Yersinia kristensenii]CNK42141.1 flagellar protein [Yersinia kristensenii]
MIDAISKSAPVVPGSFTGELLPQDLEQAAVQFEAVFMRTLLAQMRKAAEVLAADDDPFNSKQQRMMRDFYDDKLASTLASQRSSGIAHLLIHQLGGE